MIRIIVIPAFRGNEYLALEDYTQSLHIIVLNIVGNLSKYYC